MKSLNLAILAFALFAASTLAFGVELRARQSKDPRLTLELQAKPAPSQSQSQFDKYIEELAAAAQRDTKEDQAQMHEGSTQNKLPKPINPLVLFRW